VYTPTQPFPNGIYFGTYQLFSCYLANANYHRYSLCVAQAN
jgi:hypothetical protein